MSSEIPRDAFEWPGSVGLRELGLAAYLAAYEHGRWQIPAERHGVSKPVAWGIAFPVGLARAWWAPRSCMTRRGSGVRIPYRPPRLTCGNLRRSTSVSGGEVTDLLPTLGVWCSVHRSLDQVDLRICDRRVSLRSRGRRQLAAKLAAYGSSRVSGGARAGPPPSPRTVL